MNDGCSSAHTCWKVRKAAFLWAWSRLVCSVFSAASIWLFENLLKFVVDVDRNEMYRLGSGSSGRLAHTWASNVPLVEFDTSCGVVTCCRLTVTYCLNWHALH